jgi:hypothetical protein
LAYPRHLILVVSVVVAFAAVLEILQLVTPDRHGQFANAFVKATGGLAGVAAGFMGSHFARGDPDR